MTRTAIVTLSCPHCGGRTDGVRSIESPQTLPCPYCRTELHVPRVGERVIERERIIERVVEVKPMEEPPSLVSTLVAVVLAFVALLVMAVMRCGNDESLASATQSYEQRQQHREACKHQCVASCPAAERTVSQLTRREAGSFDEGAWDRALARDRCVMDCNVACVSKP